MWARPTRQSVCWRTEPAEGAISRPASGHWGEGFCTACTPRPVSPAAATSRARGGGDRRTRRTRRDPAGRTARRQRSEPEGTVYESGTTSRTAATPGIRPGAPPSAAFLPWAPESTRRNPAPKGGPLCVRHRTDDPSPAARLFAVETCREGLGHCPSSLGETP